jgi:hypothetical protein
MADLAYGDMHALKPAEARERLVKPYRPERPHPLPVANSLAKPLSAWLLVPARI